MSSPLVLLTVLSNGSGCCGSSCDSASCGAATQRTSFVGARNNQRSDLVSFDERRVNLCAIPSTGTYVSTIDLDLTVECNLRCIYCFKEKWNEHMEECVAFDAVIWLLHASGPRKSVTVNFMGGEPLIRFKLIKKLVPFGKRRAAALGKRIHFGMTTNGTLVTDEVVAFWKHWGMGFHTSIDGTPDVQDKNRPTASGRGSSNLVAKAVPKILSYRPQTCARSTIMPDNVDRLVDNYRYFRSLNYVDIAMVPGAAPNWSEHDIRAYEQEFQHVANLYIDDLRQGHFVRLKGVDECIRGIVEGNRPSHACGAGRGLLLIDIHGDIWPCHRWNKDRNAGWRIGSIYEQFNESARETLDCKSHVDLLEQPCERCPANSFCAGGCPAENLEFTGSVFKRHWNSCELTRVWARVGRYVHDTLLAERNPLFMQQYYSRDQTIDAAKER